ncbi:MAG: DUF192 domain-containing protein [Firmicutes bacterium]|nr:DUF192 domain-containing protein [Bacillota bacterium]
MRVIKNKKSINLKYCNNFFNRFKGFMFSKNINIGLCFPKCNSIHTMFMLRPIDVIMTDKNYKILYIFKSVKPYRIILPKKDVYYTFEIPTNTFEFKINEKIKVK